MNGRHDGRSKGDGSAKVQRCKGAKVRTYEYEAKRWGYHFELFKKVSLAKVGIVSDILQAHEVWKILLWR